MNKVTTNATEDQASNRKEKAGKATAGSSGAKVRKMTVTAMLSAIAFVLMFLDFSVPFMPSFIKMDLSELPALIGSFALGPVSGAVICLIKNLLHLFVGNTGGVGELSNFILGACFVLPAGLIYRKWKGKKAAALGALLGAFLMATVSIASNYFIVYPVYYALFMPEETVLSMYRVIVPGVSSILECLVKFNAPFTFFKGLLSVIITLLIYKPLSPVIKGTQE